jgi:TolA-binding protein
MKFVKLILIIGIFTICAGLHREASKTKSKAKTMTATSYQSQTKALRIETGYKELMRTTGSNSNGIEIKLSSGTTSLECEIDMLMMCSSSFNSGVPLYFKNGISGVPQNLQQNLLKLNDKTYYIPYNTIVVPYSNLDSDTASVSFSLNNKFGLSQIQIDAKYTGRLQMSLLERFLDFVSKLNSCTSKRKEFIIEKFGEVRAGIFKVLNVQEEIELIKESDVERKNKIEANIKVIQKEITDLEAKLVQLNAQRTQISTTLQKSTTEIDILTKQVQTKTTLVISYTNQIETLKKSANVDERIKTLETEKAVNLQTLEYWLNGSIFHRIISESEMKEALNLVLDDKKFADNIDNKFYPQ